MICAKRASVTRRIGTTDPPFHGGADLQLRAVGDLRACCQLRVQGDLTPGAVEQE